MNRTVLITITNLSPPPHFLLKNHHKAATIPSLTNLSPKNLSLYRALTLVTKLTVLLTHNKQHCIPYIEKTSFSPKRNGYIGRKKVITRLKPIFDAKISLTFYSHMDEFKTASKTHISTHRMDSFHRLVNRMVSTMCYSRLNRTFYSPRERESCLST